MHSPIFRSLLRGLQSARQANLAAAGEAPPTSLGGPVTHRLWRKRAGAANGVAATAPFAHLAHAGAGAGQPRIAVVGASLAGLNAAYRLAQRGLRATVFEARQRIAEHSFSPDGLGGCLIDTDHADMRALARTFAIPLYDRGADMPSARGVDEVVHLLDGRKVSEAELAEALRPLAAQIMADADRLDADFATLAPELDQLSVADYLLRHRTLIHAGYVRRLIGRAIRAEYGVEPDRCPALQLLFNLPTVDGRRVEARASGNDACLLEGGSMRVIQELAGTLRDGLRLGHALRRLDPHRHGYRLTFAGGQVAEAEVVILALPFHVLRQVELCIDVPSTLRRFIEEVGVGTGGKLAHDACACLRPGQLTSFGEHLWTEAARPWERQEVRVGGLFFVGRWLSDAFFGSMNGAAETGRLAAEALARHVGAVTARPDEPSLAYRSATGPASILTRNSV